MARYVSKPVYLEAEQWFPGKEINGVRIVPARTTPSLCGGDAIDLPEQAVVDTWQGTIGIEPGDYVFTNHRGERDALRKRAFEELFSLV